MENPALRTHYQMKEKQTGVLLTYIAPGSTTQGIVQTGDVLLAIEGRPIANDGTIPFRGNERIRFANAVHTKFIGETVRCRILRKGKVMDITIPLSTSLGSARLVPYTQYDRAPTYYIVGGLVFQPLTSNYLDTLDNENIPVHLATYYYYGRQSEDRKQVIVLTKVLGDDLTVGYDDFKDHVITQVNGKRISTIEDMVKAIEETEGTYHVFMDEWGDQIVLERNKINKVQKKILKKYKIDSERSADLRGVK
jgi:PDZ domain-containing secreted protein